MISSLTGQYLTKHHISQKAALILDGNYGFCQTCMALIEHQFAGFGTLETGVMITSDAVCIHLGIFSDHSAEPKPFFRVG